MTVEEIRRKKIERGLSVQQLAELSGVPLGTVQKIVAGITKAPRRETLLALEEALEKGAAESGFIEKPYCVNQEGAAVALRENAAEYGLRQTYTLKEYLALPDDQRVELIDGTFYDMASPHTGHQAFAGLIYKQLLDYVMEKGGGCVPMISPLDVQLDRDDKTVVQPDVMVVCDRKKFRNGRVWGAPDLVIEILSPSTRRKDMSIKLYKYQNAGVREYWMIDPYKQTVLVYDIEHEDFPQVYGPTDKIPVLIWNGACEVDMEIIFRMAGFLYEE